MWRWTPGDVYVTDIPQTGGDVGGGLHTQTVLPFTGLDRPMVWRWTAPATVYVTDSGNNRVLKLAAGSSTQTVLPFTGLDRPDGVAVDTAGDVYVTDCGQQPGGEAGGGLKHPDGAAVHRPQVALAVWRWTPPATSTSPTPATTGC